MRVLVVEDERALAEAIARGLRREGMAVDVAYDGDTGHEKATVTRYDVVVLDRDLPGMSGDRLCAEIVAAGATTRVLMLTASRSTSPNSSPAAAPLAGAPRRPHRLCWWPGTSRWTRLGASSAAPSVRWSSPARSSGCSRC